MAGHAKAEIESINSEACCSICLQSLEMERLGRQTLPCGHVLHEQCVVEMRRRGSSGCCPLCRQSHAELTPLQVLVDEALVHYSRKSYDKSACSALQVLELDVTHAHMNHLLGELYYGGKGVTKDLERACEFWEEAHSQGSVSATINLGLLYQEQGNLCKAMEFHEKGRSLGRADAAHHLGVLFEQMGNIPRAMELYEEAHHQGYLRATYSLGVNHERQRNYKKALEFYTVASNGGHVKAMDNLGGLYQKLGDTAKTKKFHEAAYRLGHINAACNLGVVYYREGNVRKAAEFYLQACHEGHTQAMNNLANLYADQGDLDRAVELLEKSRCLGNVSATTNLGALYFDKGDINKAEVLYKEAHRLGDIQATKNLRNLYQRNMRNLSAEARKTETNTTSQLQEQGPLDMMLNQACDESSDNTTDHSLAPIFSIGDYVRLHDLNSSAGRLLNGGIGKVVVHSPCGQRFGVDIANKGLKSIKPENLSLIAMPPSEPAAISPDELNAQVAIEASLQEAGGSSVYRNECNVNAQVSDALLRSRAGEQRPHILLKFSRSPQTFLQSLLKAPELADCRHALDEHGLSVQLEGGAKAFVKPENYQAVMKAIYLGGWKLYTEHVVVDPDLDALVVDIVKRMPKKEKVYPRSRSVIPTGLAGMAACDDGCRITVTRTFIHISVPSSMCSTQSDGPKTATTTDADDRKSKNPRRKNKSSSSGAQC